MSADKRKPVKKKNRFVEKAPIRKARQEHRRKRFATVFGLLLFLGIFSSVCVLSYAWMTQTPMFSARFVMVSGNTTLSHTEVLDASDIRSGDNIFGVNLELAQARLTTHPWVDTASVMREFPNRIIIRISEQTPVAVVELGKRYLINGSGEIFARSQEGMTVLPLIQGATYGSLPLAGVPTPARETATSKVVNELLPVLKGLDNATTRYTVTGAKVDPDTGLNLVTSGATAEIKLGFGNYQKKIQRVNRMFALLETKIKLTAVESVDARDLDSVVIKPAKS